MAVIAPAIKGRIPTVTRESELADHAVIETHMTLIANQSFPGIYTLGGRQEMRTCNNQEQREEKKEIHNQTSHRGQKITFSNLNPLYYVIILEF